MGLDPAHPLRAAQAHVGIVGHITKDELLRDLNATELANGFLNRFLLVKRLRRETRTPDRGRPAEIWMPVLADAASPPERSRALTARHIHEPPPNPQLLPAAECLAARHGGHLTRGAANRTRQIPHLGHHKETS